MTMMRLYMSVSLDLSTQHVTDNPRPTAALSLTPRDILLPRLLRVVGI